MRLSESFSPHFHTLAGDAVAAAHTHYVIKGGRGSTKSSAVSMLVPYILKRERSNSVVMMKVGQSMRGSVYEQLKWGINQLGISQEFHFSISPLEITHKPSGMKIAFRGLDDPQKLKSLMFASGGIGSVWFEEADNLTPEEIRSALQTVMRGSQAFRAFYTFNPPRHRGHWANGYEPWLNPDTLVHTSTYLDVPPAWLGEKFFGEVDKLKASDERSYRHEYLGEPVGLGGVVFENLTLRPITDAEIANFDRVLCGVDWGFDPDPWVFEQMFYRNGTLYLFDEASAVKATNAQTGEIVRDRVGRNQLVLCDNAEPKSIRDYWNLGVDARPAPKGKGSLDYGMKWLRGLTEIVIDPKRCPVAAKEFAVYEHQRMKDGTYTSAYPDKDDHAISAVRYGCALLMNRGE